MTMHPNIRTEHPSIERVHELLDYDPETGIFRWKLSRGRQPAGAKAGYVDDGKMVVGIDGKIYRLHHVAWLLTRGVWPQAIIDHIDTDFTNNRAKNLREASFAFNSQNRRRAKRDSQAGLIGVELRRMRAGDKYRARISVNGKPLNLGTFDTAQEAAEAYVAAKRLHHPGATV